MKKLIICLFAILTVSCSLSDDTETTYIELLPIESATVPEEFVRGETYDILVRFKIPTECHAYKDIYMQTEIGSVMIAIMSTVYSGDFDCPIINTDNTVEKSFTFKPLNQDLYVLKFWLGLNADGEDDYLIFEVPVVD
ncbi:hypothetical protein BZARG_1685 [Bizionia argentinensis JUB59]|uniref:DUF4625 domain-containing protein n=1 Tax=Bizionia argentinensis JUB59 TaxID=1046627 RepID=G2EEX1_9FLAO|nr:hypothetical protein [Bizionia argentinensis]EGV42985.1 hypothetical protein BZARG_1685 [Bizionia argentinensis JUB59]